MNSLFAAFDRYPSSKGAATHIEQSIHNLFSTFPSGILFSLGDEKLSPTEPIANGLIKRFSEKHQNFLDRVLAYREFLRTELSQLNELEVVHFRDPWSGIPLLNHTLGSPKFVYEVNGLPSIELPYHYPRLSLNLLEKIKEEENICLKKADRILVPSETISHNLTSRLPEIREKITVIPNGASLPEPQPRPSLQKPYLLYFGALQKWQGLDTLLKAFADLSDLDIQLVIISSSKPRFAKSWMKFSRKLEIADRIQWKFQLSKNDLQAWVQHAELTVAPLKESSRNIDQGCSPLKVLESLAAGTPVIASDLPVVRELTDQVLVRPDRPVELALRIRALLDSPEQLETLGKAGQSRIAANFTWDHHHSRLKQFYHSL